MYIIVIQLLICFGRRSLYCVECVSSANSASRWKFTQEHLEVLFLTKLLPYVQLFI